MKRKVETRRKRIACLLMLCLLFASVLAACAKKEKSGQDIQGMKESEGQTADKGETEGTGQDEGKEQQEESEQESETADWTWPLAEQKELSVWIAWSNEYSLDPNELLGIQAIEKATNVHINWNTVADHEAGEKFGLMIASGDIPDIIRGANSYYSGGLSKMVEDGISVDLTEAVSAYMPTYMALIEGNESLQRDTVTDDGRRVAVYTITSDFGRLEGERAWGGLCVRQDWLDDLNLEIPVTIEDWHKVLTAFKGIEGCEAPLMIGKNGTDTYGSWVSAYGVGPAFYQSDGVVKYGPAEQGYKEFLETFRQWYEEGLIDKDFMANDAGFMAAGEYIGTGRAGASANIVGLTADVWKNMGYTDDPDFFLSAAPYPVQNEGEPSYVLFHMRDLIKEAVVVTTSCKDIELACRYLDYWYTKECMLYDSLGIEGDSYTIDDNGNYVLTDSLLEQVATYQSVLGTLAARYTLLTSDFGLYNWAGLDISSPQNTIEQSLIWCEASDELALPTCMTMTDEEAFEYASLYTDIQTLSQEYTVKVITGAANLEKDYETFLNKLESCEMGRCLAIQQAALDRYLAR